MAEVPLLVVVRLMASLRRVEGLVVSCRLVVEVLVCWRQDLSLRVMLEMMCADRP